MERYLVGHASHRHRFDEKRGGIDAESDGDCMKFKNLNTALSCFNGK